MNFYLGLVAIVVLGMVSVFWARSHYQNHSTANASSTAPPVVGTTTYAGLAFDVCGTLEPSLPAAASTSSAPLSAQADGVVKLAPTVKSEAGTNATVALFATGYPGLTVTSTALKIPASGSSASGSYTNGQKCPTGTPDAGKAGAVLVSYWSNFATTKPQTSTDPTALHFTGNSLVTVSFLPAGVESIKPSTTTIQAMLKTGSGTATTTTTATGATTTTAPAATTTTTTASTTTTSKQ